MSALPRRNNNPYGTELDEQDKLYIELVECVFFLGHRSNYVVAIEIVTHSVDNRYKSENSSIKLYGVARQSENSSRLAGELMPYNGINLFIPEVLKWTVPCLNLNMSTDTNRGFSQKTQKQNHGKQCRS